MGCQAEIEIGANLTFTVASHNQGTGALADADAVPAYRIYEDETGTAILTGNMAKLDDAGTLGFYSELIAATAANGFEKNKSYSIYITIVVAGVTYAVTYGVRAITTSAEIRRNADLIESNRGHHTWQGNIFYVDPVNGDTHGNGNRGGVNDPYDSVQDCHDNAITDSAHDLIILVAGAAAGVTTLTEDVTLSKRYLLIRGPGRDFLWTRTGAGDTIAVTADGIELSGFQLETAGSGSGHGIALVDADFLAVHHVWINQTRGDGINILRGSNCQIFQNTFQESGQSGSGQGVHIVGTAGSSNWNNIFRNVFADIAGNAIHIEQGSTLDTIIAHNIIHGSTGYGINIGASSTDALVTNNCLGNNTSGDINDGGTTTVLSNNEDIPTAAENADAAWDEILTGATHNIATSAGRRLRDLASSVIITGTSPNTSGTTNTSIRIELDGAASAVAGAYDPAGCTIVAGTGAGQSREIWEYGGADKLAWLNRDWKVTPDDTSEYVISAHSGNTHVNEGYARGGGASSITLNPLASSVNDAYKDQTVYLAAGVGADQANEVLSYDGATKIATMKRPWVTQPVNEQTMYAVLPPAHLGPTLAEMDTAHALLATEAKQDAIKAKTDNLPENIQKNVAFPNFHFKMVLASDHITPATGLTVTAQRLLDDGSFGSMANAAVEIAGGWYRITLAQSDTNGDVVTYKFSAGTADDREITFNTAG